jgi:cell division protein FtsB
MTSPSANESESRQIESIHKEIEGFRAQQAELQAQVKDLREREDPARGITFHADIFRLQQDKLRLDTEIQFLEVRLRRLASTW